MAKSPSPQPKSESEYNRLVSEIKALLLDTSKTGAQALNAQRLDAYWHIGRRLQHWRRTGKSFIANLSRDVQVTTRLLYRTNQFFETWPKGVTKEAQKLTWGHHVVLAGLTNSKERDFYVRTALAKAWDRETLRRALQNDYFENAAAAEASALLRDHANPLHVYKAVVDAVIDGDTLLVRVDLGFHTWTEQRVRLRGVNAAELPQKDIPSEAPENATRAQAFVTEKLQHLPFVVIKTHKTDIYGRYVADVFYHPKFTDLHDVAAKGIFLNEELLKAGLAVRALE